MLTPQGWEIEGVYDSGHNGDGSHCTVGRGANNMQRAESSVSEGSFWKTIELLAGRGRRRSAADAEDVVLPVHLTRTASSLR